jgi:hypothetical protein
MQIGNAQSAADLYPLPKMFCRYAYLTFYSCTAGLTALEELVMFPPIDPRHFNEGFPTVPSDAALNQLTKLTCLGLQVGITCGRSSRQNRHTVCGRTLRCSDPQVLCNYCAQVAGVEPGNGSIQASVSRLRRLARLCVAATLEGNVCELPPGFGSLSTLTFLRFATVCRENQALVTLVVYK